MGSLSTRATLVPRGQAAAVVLTDEQVATVGEGAKRFPVVATVNEGARAEAGDSVDLELELDTKPREVELPPALAAALAADSEALAVFEQLSYTHRKEHARWVAEAKRDETRERRVAKTLDRLRELGQ